MHFVTADKVDVNTHTPGTRDIWLIYEMLSLKGEIFVIVHWELSYNSC